MADETSVPPQLPSNDGIEEAHVAASKVDSDIPPPPTSQIEEGRVPSSPTTNVLSPQLPPAPQPPQQQTTIQAEDITSDDAPLDDGVPPPSSPAATRAAATAALPSLEGPIASSPSSGISSVPTADPDAAAGPPPPPPVPTTASSSSSLSSSDQPSNKSSENQSTNNNNKGGKPVVSSSKKSRPPYKYDPSKVTLRFLFAGRDGLTVTVECKPGDTVGEVKGALLSVWPEGLPDCSGGDQLRLICMGKGILMPDTRTLEDCQVPVFKTHPTPVNVSVRPNVHSPTAVVKPHQERGRHAGGLGGGGSSGGGRHATSASQDAALYQQQQQQADQGCACVIL